MIKRGFYSITFNMFLKEIFKCTQSKKYIGWDFVQLNRKIKLRVCHSILQRTWEAEYSTLWSEFCHINVNFFFYRLASLAGTYQKIVTICTYIVVSFETCATSITTFFSNLFFFLVKLTFFELQNYQLLQKHASGDLQKFTELI